jgi:hypothetical protein
VFQRRADMITGLFALALSLLIFAQTMNMKRGPAGFPFLIGVLLAAAGASLVAKTIWLKKAPGRAVFAGISFQRMIFPFGLWIAMTVVMEYLGIYLSAMIFSFLVMWYLDGFIMKPSQLIKYAVITLLLVIAIWLVFEHYLEMYLPRGILFQ